MCRLLFSSLVIAFFLSVPTVRAGCSTDTVGLAQRDNNPIAYAEASGHNLQGSSGNRLLEANARVWCDRSYYWQNIPSGMPDNLQMVGRMMHKDHGSNTVFKFSARCDTEIWVIYQNNAPAWDNMGNSGVPSATYDDPTLGFGGWSSYVDGPDIRDDDRTSSTKYKYASILAGYELQFSGTTKKKSKGSFGFTPCANATVLAPRSTTIEGYYSVDSSRYLCAEEDRITDISDCREALESLDLLYESSLTVSSNISECGVERVKENSNLFITISVYIFGSCVPGLINGQFWTLFALENTRNPNGF